MADEKIEYIDPWTQASKGFDSLHNVEIVLPDIADQSYGKNNETIDAQIGLRNLNIPKKYCFATTNVGWTYSWGFLKFEIFETNDTGMSAIANQITITESWLYNIIASAYVATDQQSHWVFIYKNWVQWAGNFDNNYYKNTYRSIRQTMKMGNMVVWDVITVFIIGSQYSYLSDSTYLQVIKLQ